MEEFKSIEYGLMEKVNNVNSIYPNIGADFDTDKNKLLVRMGRFSLVAELISNGDDVLQISYYRKVSKWLGANFNVMGDPIKSCEYNMASLKDKQSGWVDLNGEVIDSGSIVHKSFEFVLDEYFKNERKKQ